MLISQKYFSWIKKFIISLILININITASANISLTPPINKYINELVKKHHFNKKKLQLTFKKATIQPSIIKAISKPSEHKPWFDYKRIFITKKRINSGVDFWKKNQKTLTHAEKKYGIPAKIIVAILGVETFYGKYTGNYKVLDALITLSFQYPKRSKFFKNELTSYLLFTKENKIPPLSLKGSYAGAIGLPQFIPSSIRHYAIDFNNDGKINLRNSPADAIGSIANYFKKHGWKTNYPIVASAKDLNKKYLTLYKKQHKKPLFTIKNWEKNGLQITPLPKNKKQKALLISFPINKSSDKKNLWLGYKNFYVITRYNHSLLYAMAVYQLSNEIEKHKNTKNKKS